MKLLKQIQFMSVFFDEQKRLLLHQWKDGNDNLDENELKEIISQVTVIIKEYAPIYFIADDSNRKCIFTVKIQNWIASVIAEACITIGLKSLAIIVPKELIAYLSTEQTVEEAGQLPFEIKYFADKNEALTWIKNSEKA